MYIVHTHVYIYMIIYNIHVYAHVYTYMYIYIFMYAVHLLYIYLVYIDIRRASCRGLQQGKWMGQCSLVCLIVEQGKVKPNIYLSSSM